MIDLHRRRCARNQRRLLLAAVALVLGGCHRRPPSPEATAPAASPRPPTSSAHPPEFVHPPIPPEPSKEARPECSTFALGHVAARIREVQKRAAGTAEPGRKPDRRTGCGSPIWADLDREVRTDLDDRVRMCVGQDGPLDAEWNTLSFSLSSLGVCLDCQRAARDRAADCRRARTLVDSAEAATQQKAPAPR